jgi:hypothetical protein
MTSTLVTRLRRQTKGSRPQNPRSTERQAVVLARRSPMSRMRTKLLAALAAVILQTTVAIGVPILSSPGTSTGVPVAAAATCPAGYETGPTRHQKDNFAWVGSNTYRLHGWLFYNQCTHYGCNLYRICRTVAARDWHSGEDSRACDGCAYKSVSAQRLHLRYWDCGDLGYDAALTHFNVSLTNLSPGIWEDDYGCGAQGDLSGHQERSGIFSYDYYLNY